MVNRQTKRAAAKARRRERQRDAKEIAIAKAAFFEEMRTIDPVYLRRFIERGDGAKAARQRLMLSEHCPPGVTHGELIRRSSELLGWLDATIRAADPTRSLRACARAMRAELLGEQADSHLLPIERAAVEGWVRTHVRRVQAANAIKGMPPATSDELDHHLAAVLLDSTSADDLRVVEAFRTGAPTLRERPAEPMSLADMEVAVDVLKRSKIPTAKCTGCGSECLEADPQHGVVTPTEPFLCTGCLQAQPVVTD